MRLIDVLHDERGFIHKKIFSGFKGAVSSVVSSVTRGSIPTPFSVARGAAGGFFRGGATPFTPNIPCRAGESLADCVARRARGAISGVSTPRPTLSRAHTARVSPRSRAEVELGRSLKFGNGNGNGEFLGGDPECFIPGQRVDPNTGKCRWFLGEETGPNGGFPMGEAVKGDYGAGFIPGSMAIHRAVCGKKMQLGDDGICYNRSQISNQERMWPAGRRPLLSGGDMRAISIAARAGKRLELAQKRLQKMGMMKKPTRRAGPARHAALLEAHVATSK